MASVVTKTIPNRTKGSKDITVIIEPLSKSARSLLPEVMDQLELLIGFLRSLTDEETTFEVISLGKQSSLTAVLRGLIRTRESKKSSPSKRSYSYKRDRQSTERAAKTFGALNSNSKLPAYADPYSLVQLRDLAEEFEKTEHKATIIVDGNKFEVDERLKKQIDSSLGKTRISYTSFTGRLDRVHVHGERWTFTIFPVVGPTRVLCFFDKSDIDSIKDLVAETVTVRGRAVYRGDSPWPIQIQADDVKRRAPAPEGSWSDLPTRLRSDWLNASDEDKDLLVWSAEVA